MSDISWDARSNWGAISPAQLSSRIARHFDRVHAASMREDFMEGAAQPAPENACAACVRGGREYMEDGVALARDFAAVVDGHGGSETMQLVTQLLDSSEFRNYLAAEQPTTELELQQRARHTIAQLERAVDAAQTGDGATIALATRHRMRNGRDVWTVASLGDSRVLLISPRAVQQVHIDHNTNTRSEVRRVESFRPLFLNRLKGRLMLTRSLGDGNYKDAGLSRIPDISVLQPQRGDLLLLASDGLFDALSNEHVAATLRTLVAVADARRMSVNFAAILAWLAVTCRSLDNVSVIVVRL